MGTELIKSDIEKIIKKREWVKNAIIIFLVVMLLLTFFSNTIMNYSLPEVAAQYAKSDTISEQIRGNGNIEASETYDVKIDESRVISSVAVKIGDTVEKGQVMLNLEDVESAELKTAQDTLDTLNLEYQTAILKQTGSDYALDYLDIKNNEEDIVKAKEELSNIAVYENEYETAKSNTDEKNDAVNELTKQADAVSYQLEFNADDYSQLEGENFQLVDAAQKRLAAADKYKKDTDATVVDLEGKVKDGVTDDTLSALRKSVETKEAELNNLRASYFAAWADDKIDEASAAEKSIANAEIELRYARSEYSNAVSKQGETSRHAASLRTALASQKKGNNSFDSATENLKNVMNMVKKELKDKQNDIKYELVDANEELKKAEELEAEAKEKASLTVDKAEMNIRELERSLEEKKVNLTEKQKTDMEASGVSALELEAKQEKIKEQEELIQRLKEKTVGATVKAPVGGVISQLNCTAGQSTAAGEPLAVIEMTELGYSMEITITNEQAEKIKVGDEAEIQYFWYGEASARVQSIKPDTADPTRNKTVTFSVTGDVEPGMNLQVAMGGKGQNYDCVIPNSAVREDNNGKFVLSVVAKSSPLGNRYIAERVDVEVLASDGTYSAVSGGLYGNEFVIITSSKPIESGMQVRMAQN